MTTTPNFEDTKVAFKAWNDRELFESYLVFKSLGMQKLVNFGTGLIAKALEWHLPITPIVRYTVFKQFCGGVDADDCFPIVERLGGHGVYSILDYSVEAQESDEEMDRVTEEICNTIKYGRDRVYIPFAVFKVTGIMPFFLLEKVSQSDALVTEEKHRWEQGKARFKRICSMAATEKVRLLVDAEETWIQPAIDDLAEEAMAAYNKDEAVVFNTLQMYRSDRLAYLNQVLARAQAGDFKLGIKLVRGAYMEKERARAKELGYPNPIQPDKAATDRDFDAAVKFCLEQIDRTAVFIGTHNETSTKLAVDLMQKLGIEPGDTRVYFSQLYGMSDNLSFNLAQNGYLAAKYLPYGPVKAVLPYLFRRAQENSSIKGQASRELQLIQRELRRRKH